MTRAELLKQVIAKLSDRFAVNEQDINEDTRLFGIIAMWDEWDLELFAWQLEEELGITPIDVNQVKFWRSVRDIINSYKTDE